MEILGHAVLQAEPMMVRSRLLRLLESQCPPLTLVCAAAGYGKSVLAAQVAVSGAYDAVIWVELPDIDASATEVVQYIGDALDVRTAPEVGPISASACAVDDEMSDVLLLLREKLTRFAGKRVLLLIDGVNELRSIHSVVEVASYLRTHVGTSARTIMNCRRIPRDSRLDPRRVWLIEEDDLRLSADEVAHLLLHSGRESRDEDDVDALLALFGGHPAMTHIMLRHDFRCGDFRPRDLVWQVEHIVGRFDEHEVAALYVAALLREGLLTTLQQCAVACDLIVDWSGLSRAMPLLSLMEMPMGALGFRAHSVLADVAHRVAKDRLDVDDLCALRSIIYERMWQTRDYAGLAHALELYGSVDEVAAWSEQAGFAMMRHVGHAVSARLMSRLPMSVIASSARLLVLLGHLKRAQGMPHQAMDCGASAKCVARAAGDEESLVAAVLLTSRLHLDRGRMGDARGDLERLRDHPALGANVAARCLCEAYLAVAEAQSGLLEEALARTDAVRHMLPSLDLGSDEAVLAANCAAAVACQCLGSWTSAVEFFAPIACRSDISVVQRLHLRTNYATALAELGEVDTAEEILGSVISEVANLKGLEALHAYALGTLANIMFVTDRTEDADEAHSNSMAILEQQSDDFGVATYGIDAARSLRAMTENHRALSTIERSLILLESLGEGARMTYLAAMIEAAATHLALDEPAIAVELIHQVEPEIRGTAASGHLFRSDLVMAEVERREGRVADAVQILTPYTEYIRSGSPNMTLAFYVRAFPGLLGLAARAVGPLLMSAKLLWLVPVRVAEAARTSEMGLLTADEWTYIASRCRPEESPERTLMGRSMSAPPDTNVPVAAASDLHVKLFGRLEVTGPGGRVEEEHWCKRKSRRLFLMLVCRQGCDLSRDVILEYLWPDMDRERALRNFYVTWSALKTAILSGERGNAWRRFLVCTGGVCRVTEAVHSDIADFGRCSRTIREANSSGRHADVVEAGELLAEVYRGDLLPADLYESWFEEDRARFKREFCDAMLVAADSAYETGRYDAALSFLRRASATDPWREDVYQMIMRCQMTAGQRSGAIETYHLCRTRLVDDLGIDPCSETTELFQAVLAMEDGE
ncbi:AfsR/SARP family transcriptional regulator [Anaerosoma tenue]|uniref:AfsR/SARP family transcriptional regulator n=1 Tax=Anaerosoma tenue TaxID=2933588 RepID=UPI002260AD54|nr:BTAD domain-containing putative transcriptional regulator [Anaerosoma tenue]MCK8114567.1 hypothetical protein [Anaerosoma tenue]